MGLLATNLSIWAGHVLWSRGGQEGFSLFYMSFLLFSFFRWWCGMVCVPPQGWGERKACSWILSRRSNKSPLSRAAFCVQSANRRPEIISHNSPLQKQETLESPDDCEGAYEREIERGRTRAERKRGRERERSVLASVSFCSSLWLFWM